MSVSNVVVKQTYIADGVTTQFAIPFAFFPGTAEDVTKVYLVDRTTGAKTLQVIGDLNDYTLPHAVDTEPALVVFNAAPGNVNPALTVDVLVEREIDLIQSTRFLNSGKLLLKNIEDAVDYLTMLIQQVNDPVVRTLKISEIDSLAGFDPTFAPGLTAGVANAGKALIINSTGTGFALGLSTDELATILDQVQTLADAAALSANSAASSASGAAASANTASTAATNAANSATAAAASAAAAAASAASGAGVPVAQTTVSEGSTGTLSGDSNDHTVNNMVDYSGRVVRGSTVMSRVAFTIFYRGGAWELAFGESRWANADDGVTWTVDATTGTPKATVPTDGRGNAVIDLKKIPSAV